MNTEKHRLCKKIKAKSVRICEICVGVNKMLGQRLATMLQRCSQYGDTERPRRGSNAGALERDQFMQPFSQLTDLYGRPFQYKTKLKEVKRGF